MFFCSRLPLFSFIYLELPSFRLAFIAWSRFCCHCLYSGNDADKPSGSEASSGHTNQYNCWLFFFIIQFIWHLYGVRVFSFISSHLKSRKRPHWRWFICVHYPRCSARANRGKRLGPFAPSLSIINWFLFYFWLFIIITSSSASWLPSSTRMATSRCDDQWGKMKSTFFYFHF